MERSAYLSAREHARAGEIARPAVVHGELFARGSILVRFRAVEPREWLSDEAGCGRFRFTRGIRAGGGEARYCRPALRSGGAGFELLAVYVTHREAIFVLEGEEPQWREDDLVNEFLQPALRQRLDEWRKLGNVQTWPAQPVFFWEASADE